MKISSLQSRIVIFFVLLMLVTQLGGLVLINTVGETNARQTIGDELVIGERVFNRLIEQKSMQLAQGARILSSDYAFREALASNDQETIVSALKNHGARINAQVMMLIGLDKKIIADTLNDAHRGKSFFLPQLIDAAEAQGKASSIVNVDGSLNQLVIVPVRAPVTMAWVAMGFTVDNAVVQDLQRLTGLEVSFLSKGSKTKWVLQASTLADDAKKGLEANWSSGLLDQVGILTVNTDSDEYMTLVSKQPSYNEDTVVAVLQQSLNRALKSFKRLQHQLLIFSTFGLLLSVLGAIAIARGIAGPVQQLASFARRIATGDYSNPPEIQREDEIGDLSSAFDHMRANIVRRESEIKDLAYSDKLTRLPNRTMFTKRLQEAIDDAAKQSSRFSILLMDLDHFKYVNDTLGHHMGDLLLCEVTRRIQSIANEPSCTIARLGGDEFAVLLPGETTVEAKIVAEAILRALEVPMTLEGHVVDMRGSIGIAGYPDHGENLQSLLRHADMAMYLAKRNNSGFSLYDASQDQHSAERLSLMSQLRKAVEEDELVLYYQPKISLTEPRQNSVEALIRWQHPQRGFIPPFEFIPFAEQTGYIKVITLWVLNRAIEQCAQWHRDGIDISISVNISARDLMNAELPTIFANALAKHECMAEWICLELTESAILDDPGHALENLTRLHALGCRLSIDDYGTGYSSLSYLKQLPVDEMKIDKSFVMDMVNDQDDAIIVRSTIDLAHNMGLKVVAEGVENEAILNRLKEMGCDVAQGYLISKPISGSDLIRWMRESPWCATQQSKADGSALTPNVGPTVLQPSAR